MSVLARILQRKREEIAALKKHGHDYDRDDAGPVRPFADALFACAHRSRAGVIGEFKRKSPSSHKLASTRAAPHPATMARAYQDGGATCLSVLTDGHAFAGSLADLGAAREAVTLPVLRKDFMIDPCQIAEARFHGADAILLIMAAMDDFLAADLCAQAMESGMAALIEIHDEEELDRAMMLPSPLIGINNRDLTDLRIDLRVTERLAPRVPPDRLVIAESGIESCEDILRLREVNARAFLVGSSLMRATDPVHMMRSLAFAAQAKRIDHFKNIIDT